MWISKHAKEELYSMLYDIERERDEWKAKYLAVTKGNVICKNEAIIVSREILSQWRYKESMAQAELKRLVPELEMWKQKYADEVQKRLALVEQMQE